MFVSSKRHQELVDGYNELSGENSALLQQVEGKNLLIAERTADHNEIVRERNELKKSNASLKGRITKLVKERDALKAGK